MIPDHHEGYTVQLKKRILRTVIKEVVVGATADPPRVILKLHWAGGTHTELIVRKNQTGHHEHVSSGEVIDLIRELSQVCEDGATILNRLGYRTGVANTRNEKRVQHVRHTRGFPACPPPGERRWLTMEQTAQVLDVSMMVVRRLIAQQILPAKQIVKFAPWIIERADLELPSVRKEIRRVHEGRRLASIVHNNNEQHRLFKDAGEM